MPESRLTSIDKTNLIRLAVAMRAGAALRPQTQRVLYRRIYDKNNQKQICSCALGAAWEGSHPDFEPAKWLSNFYGIDEEVSTGLGEINQYFGHLNRMPVLDPFTLTWSYVDSVIIDMNDRKAYTREMIADWLLSIAE